MNVRYLLAASLCLAGAVQAADQAPAPANPRQTLQFNDCMRTDRINDWHVIDDRTVTIRNGPDHFLIKTSTSCPRIGLGGGIRFRTSEATKAMGGGRICGDPTEQIVRRHSDPPCQIQSIEKIDKTTFDQLTKKAKRNGSGAEPNGAVP